MQMLVNTSVPRKTTYLGALGRRIALGGTAAALAMVLATTADAQSSTGNIQGFVRGPGGAPLSDATVVARDVQVGGTRGTMTNEAGFYNLAGLRPGTYALEVRRIGFSPQSRQTTVQIGQNIVVNFELGTATTTLSAVTVTAAPAVETRTSEIATNVTEQQINSLPTADRNFMSLAVLAPGVTVQGDQLDGQRKTFSAGAQGPDQVNVFIDGASYKNDILQGGVAGQDASRGNPFPRNAVQEYRVLTQNYKAEYQKASSAIITATTKTGGTKWEGNVFFNTLTRNWVALDRFDRDRRAAAEAAFKKNPAGGYNFSRPDYRRVQMGVSGGGPLSERFRLFGSYEGQEQDRANIVNIIPPSGYPALDSVNFAQYNGKFQSPFRSHLLFGKLTFLQSEQSTWDLSLSGRTENDIRNFGTLTAYTAATRFNNDVYTGVLKNVFTRGNILSEATASFQHYQYNPVPESPGPIARLYGFGCCATIGANRSAQDFTQRRASLREDLTYAGFQWAGQHVVKGGVNLDFVTYDVIKRNSETPLYVYETWFDSARTPERVEFQTGNPEFSDDNTQLGLYLQDDWTPVERLTFNLGIRWDYESNMLNRDYVTPTAIRDSLVKYQDRLFAPLDQERYFTDGSQRDAFLGAFQPRVGASYSIDEGQRTTLFGGWGIYIDRTLFDLTTEESFAQQHPSYLIRFRPAGSPPDPNRTEFDPSLLTRGKAATDSLAQLSQFRTPEIKLLPNDLRPPMSQQFTAGVRQLIGSWALEAAYTGVRSKNVPTFSFVNMNFVCPTRSFGTPGCFVENRIPGFGTVLFLDDNGKTWYNALAVKADRVYRESRPGFGWGAGIAYTLAERETEGYNDNFSFVNASDYPRQVRNDERHRIVSNFIVDLPYLFGVQMSGLITLGSGVRYDRGDRFGCERVVAADPSTCTIRTFQPGEGVPEQHSFFGLGNWGYRSVDLHLRKDFLNFAGNRLGVTADLLNVFNYQNYGGYSNAYRTTNPDGTYNTNFARPGRVITDPRRFQLGAEYNF